MSEKERSLASAARGSDLPGVTTAKMLEQMMEGYEAAFQTDFHVDIDAIQPKSIRKTTKEAAAASWVTLANDRIENAKPTIPLGRRIGRSQRPSSRISASSSSRKNCMDSPPCCARATTMLK